MASVDRRANGKYLARWREYPGGPQRSKQFARKFDAEAHLVKMQHSSPTITLTTYAHLMSADEEVAQAVLDEALLPRAEDQVRTSGAG